MRCPPKTAFGGGNGGLRVGRGCLQINRPVIPEMHVAVGLAVSAGEVNQTAGVGAGQRFTAGVDPENGRVLLIVIVGKQHIGIDTGRTVHGKRNQSVVEPVVVQRVRIEGCKVIDPNALGAQQPSDFAHH